MLKPTGAQRAPPPARPPEPGLVYDEKVLDRSAAGARSDAQVLMLQDFTQASASFAKGSAQKGFVSSGRLAPHGYLLEGPAQEPLGTPSLGEDACAWLMRILDGRLTAMDRKLDKLCWACDQESQTSGIVDLQVQLRQRVQVGSNPSPSAQGSRDAPMSATPSQDLQRRDTSGEGSLAGGPRSGGPRPAGRKATGGSVGSRPDFEEAHAPAYADTVSERSQGSPQRHSNEEELVTRTVSRRRSRKGTVGKRLAQDIAEMVEVKATKQGVSDISGFQWPDERASSKESPSVPKETDGDAANTQGADWCQPTKSVHETIREVDELAKSSGTNLDVHFGSSSQSRKRTSTEMIWTFLEEPNSSPASQWYGHFSLLLTLAAVVIPVMMTLEDPPLSRQTSVILENIFDAVFGSEVLIRWAVSPYYLAFLWSPYNVIDLFSIVTLCLRTYLNVQGVEYTALWLAFFYCLVPMARVLKALRASPNLRLLKHALAESWEALVLPLFMLMVITLIFAGLIFILEPRDEVVSIPHAMYFVIVTVTTVGYGDMSPKEDSTKCVVVLLMIIGVLYMAMPLTIVGNAFIATWEQRDYLVLVQRVRDRLIQWDYTGDDARNIFSRYDVDHDGELTSVEFCKMILDMRLGLRYAEILRVFECFDADESGAVHIDEFVEMIFPPGPLHTGIGMARSRSQLDKGAGK